jgi:hypothetical protein
VREHAQVDEGMFALEGRDARQQPTAPTTSGSRKRPPWNWSSMAAMRWKLSASKGSKAWPSSVRARPRGRRRKSVTLRRASRFFTCAATADWVTLSSSPARVKLRWRADASKARKALRGRFMAWIFSGLALEISVCREERRWLSCRPSPQETTTS